MLGKNPLWVARQHGHTVRTMLEVYAAWADGAVESDVAAIRRSMRISGITEPSRRTGWFRRLLQRWLPSGRGEMPQPAAFSIWHWIWHQERGACT